MFTPARRPHAAALLTLAMLVVGFSIAQPHVALAQGRALYVAPNGVAGRDGSLANPIDLASALSAGGPARPGDTIWLRGGTYSGAFTSTLNGTASAPITVRQYPGERATLDNGATPTLPTLVVNGSWTTFWGFEIMNSNPTRFIDVSGRGTGLDVYGPNTKFINLVIHDAQNGVGLWSSAVNAELYGSLIYNNGIEWTDRGHGHSIYTQNASGTKRLEDNIMFNGFSFGIHAYTQGGAIDNFVMDGNVSFNHGNLSSGGRKSNLLLGGGQVARNPIITNNHLYNSPATGGRGADLGYGTACASGRVQNNVFVSDTALMFNCSATTLSGNHIYGGYNFPAGTYSSNTYYSARPAGSWVTVRPNRYEPGRGHIVIYNWARAGQVAVNLAQAGLAPGDGYEIKDAQNFYGPPVVNGVYNGGTVNVPMTSNVVALPIGNAHVTPQHTGLDFGVFVVLRTSGSTGPTAPTVSLSASPASISGGQSATLSWTSANATSVSINNGIGAVAATGTRVVSPTATTTYVVTATNSAGQSTTANTTVTVASAPATPAAVTFVGIDAATRGNWRGVYGAGGYSLAPSTSTMPSTAPLSVDGPSYTWTASTTEPRALQLPTGSARIAAAWYSTQSFTMTLNITDGQPRRIAVYALDWDRQLRAQRFEIVDAATGVVLDARDASAFGDGIYWIWRISGRVQIRVVRTGGPSPVAAAIFLDSGTATPPPATPAPTVSISASPATVNAGQSATLTWSSANATSVSINQGVGAVAASGTRVVTPSATTTYTVTAANATSQVSASTSVTVNSTPQQPQPPTGTSSATFAGADTTTQGNWRGVYGGEGFTIAPADTTLPSYAQVAVGGVAYTWDGNAAETRALQRSAGASRIAAAWYSSDAFAFNVRVTDGASHHVALYSLDWDRQGRAQSIEVLDAATLALLDRRDASSFGNGVYHRWVIKGHVVFRITRTAGPSPVIAGMFFGAATAPTTPAPPTVSLAATPAAIAPGASATLSWQSTNAASVTITPTVGTVAASGTRTVSPTSTTTYTATATNAAGQSVTATAVVSVSTTTPPPAGGTAVSFLGADDDTRGNWIGHYGAEGYALAPSTSSMPATTPVTVNGAAWTWEGQTTDPRALQRPGAAGRSAATWYGSQTMSINVNITDGQRRQVAVYALDWDRQGRQQQIEVVDAATGVVLDRRSSGGFGDGTYFVWEMSGRVMLRVTSTSGPGPAIGGIFVDRR